MSVLPTTSETQRMDMGLEMQERSAPLCWPHLNGTGHHNLQPPHHGLPPIGAAHHNLPPIAAITSCRPSSSPVLKTPATKDGPNVVVPPSPLASSPKPQPQSQPNTQNDLALCPTSPRDRKDEHVFAQPNPPRLVQPATRPPTPFPDNPHANTQVFQNAGLTPIRLDQLISPPPKLINTPTGVSNEPAATETNSVATPETSFQVLLPENSNDSSLKPDVGKSPPPPENRNDKTLAPVASYQQPQSNEISVADEQQKTGVDKILNHSTTTKTETTTAYEAPVVTVAMSTPAELVAPATTPNYSQAHHPPPLTQQAPEIRNYSNQNHRYFATSPAENTRPYSSPSPRNPLCINPVSSINQSDNNGGNNNSSLSPSMHRVGSIDPAEYLPKMHSPSERKIVQVPYNNENYRRLMNPTVKAQVNNAATGEVAPLVMPTAHEERFSPQAPLYNQYRGSLPHMHNPERTSNQQDVADGRNYPPGNVRIPVRQAANHPIQSERGGGGAPYYPGASNRAENDNIPQPNDRRPSYPSGSNSNAPRNYASQPDRAVLYPAPPSAQGYSVASNINAGSDRVSVPYPPPTSSSGPRPYGPTHDRPYPSPHSHQEKSYHHPERNVPNYQATNNNNQRPAQYPPTSALTIHVPVQSDKNDKYQASPLNYPSPNSHSHHPSSKKPEPVSYPNQPSGRYGFQAYTSRSQPTSSNQPITSFPANSSRPGPEPHYYRSDGSRQQPWTAPAVSSRIHETMHGYMARPSTHRIEPEKHGYHPHHGATPVPRNDNSYQHSGHSTMNPTSAPSRDRPYEYPTANSLPRINPPAVVNVSSVRSPRFSSHPTSRPNQNPYPHVTQPHSYAATGQISSSATSSFAPTLPRVNFPSPAVSSFNNMPPSSTSSPSGFVRTRAPSPHIQDSRHLQSREPSKNQSQAPGRPGYSYSPQLGSRPIAPSYNAAPRQPTIDATLYRTTNSSQYTPTRGHGMETDTCRNPFELPTPTSQSRAANSGGVIKSHYSVPNQSYGQQQPQQPVETKNPSMGGFAPRSPYNNYPASSSNNNSSNSTVNQCDNNSQPVPIIRYPVPPVRTEHHPPSSGNDNRQQKPPQLSARFPPVPQSNYDLQRQIFDRMTGVQQAPPKLIEKARAENRPPVHQVVEAPRHKRESPLDLSVKTVQQSADSTLDDVDLYAVRHPGVMESRLPGAPKIDFNPNFAGPLVQPEVRNMAPLPPVQSIRKFAHSPADSNAHAMHRKRPIDDLHPGSAPKMPKVDAWELAINEQIEEKLKAARQSRQPAAPLTPLHPPVKSITPTNPEILQPPARPPYDTQHMRSDRYRMPQGMESSRAGHRGWNPTAYNLSHPSGGPDPETIVQQISQGMMPDSRILQDNNVIDMLRTSLEKKEARLYALQAAARHQPPLQPYDQFSAERMIAPPSYPHGHHRGAEPIPIDIEPSKNYACGSGNDGSFDGLDAFLAARIRTKAEMKQMGPASSFRPPENLHMGRSMVPGISPPKLNRENRMAQGQHHRRLVMSPGSEESGGIPMPLHALSRDGTGMRSSSETSVFDFRESDSESEMPTLERQTLDGMRRPRKALPRPTGEQQPQPGPAPKDVVQPEADPVWDNVCDTFVEQLQNRPIKRSVRKKKPNPRFYANELEAPRFLTTAPPSETDVIAPEPPTPIKEEPIANLIKIKTDVPDADSEIEMPALPIVLKEESSSGDEALPGVTVVKAGRVKLVTKKQRVVRSDSEWGSSDVESSSADSEEVSSDDFDSDDNDSEDSTARKFRLRDRGDSSSSSADVPRTRKGRRTRSRAVSDDSDENVARTKTKRRSRNILKSDSDDSDRETTKVRRTRARAVSDSDESDGKKKGPRTRTRADSETDDDGHHGDKKGVKTRQNSKKTHSPGRMRLRSKKRGATKNSAFSPGWEKDLIKFKQQLRMPDRLINVTKPSKKRSSAGAASPSDNENADEKEKEVTTETEEKSSKRKIKKQRKDDDKTDESGQVSSKSKKMKNKKQDKDEGGDEKENENKSTEAPVVSKRRLGIVTHGKDIRLQKRSLRGSVGMRRSNKAVQNSKRHLNKGKKRLKLRRKFRSGFDYMRRKKKQGQRKEGDQTPTPIENKEPKRKERTEALDVSAEIKSWVVNKSAGETVLHRAARLGYADAALYCLETLHLAPSPRDHAGYTPLHEACSRGHVAVANYLLQFGANVCESARGGVRPLHQAAENSHMELVRLLLAYGADPLLATYTGQTALSLASNEDVRILIQQHLADVQGDDAPKWSFEGPATVLDPTWAVNPLADPPSPDSIPVEVEMEISKFMLPPLYRLSPVDGECCDPLERWLLLDDLVAHSDVKDAEKIAACLPNTAKCELTETDFQSRASCCNLLSVPEPRGPKVNLVRYDDAVRQLLDVEVLSVSLVDQ